MAPTMGVSALVVEMQETLATIQNTLASLDPSFHDEKLDELEKKRHDAIQALSSAFSAESEFLDRERRAERDVIAEHRGKEDEERETRRREEDEQRSARYREEDLARSEKLKEDTDEVEQETDELMSQVEEEAHQATVEGRDKLKALQEKRRASRTSVESCHVPANRNIKELNRLIEEQLDMTLPTLPIAPTRARRATRSSTSPLSLPADKILSGASRTLAVVNYVGGHPQAAHQLDRSDPAPPDGLGTAKLNLPTEPIHYGPTGQQQTQDRAEDLAVGSPATQGTQPELQSRPVTAGGVPPAEGDEHETHPGLTTAKAPALDGNHDFSGGEEGSSAFLSDEHLPDEAIYRHGSEASGPAPETSRDEPCSPCSYVSETLGEQGSMFSHPGETYIEKGECGGLEALHPGLAMIGEREAPVVDRERLHALSPPRMSGCTCRRSARRACRRPRRCRRSRSAARGGRSRWPEARTP